MAIFPEHLSTLDISNGVTISVNPMYQASDDFKIRLNERRSASLCLRLFWFFFPKIFIHFSFQVSFFLLPLFLGTANVQ